MGQATPKPKSIPYFHTYSVQIAMIFTLDTNEITLQPEGQNLRLTTHSGDNLLLTNPTPSETQSVITHNYHLVKAHFAPNLNAEITSADFEKVCLKIVLGHFYIYQMWRSLYEKEKNRDLTFLEKDFNHPSTSDTVISYFKSTYPKKYASKSAAFLGMTLDQFEQHEKNRQLFMDR